MAGQVPVQSSRGGMRDAQDFFVYVEGPRDRDVLRAWARRASPRLAKRLAPVCVILGGRQPARAMEDLSRRREQHPSASGLCVLDGDDFGSNEDPREVSGLEWFVWRRRHIESYLLVPDAIERALRNREVQVGPVFREAEVPLADERLLASFDAKAFLGARGPLALAGGAVPPGRIARAMRPDELHPDVQALLGRISQGLGVIEPLVAVRSATPARWPAGLS
ncbi:MAG: hypothetical protein OEP95_07935 [Myxococcales bacterium]|nr:hypothetical protein [Myxococcales bacterium]